MSLAWGAQGKTLGVIVRGTAEIASAPFLAAFNKIDDGASYLTGLVFSYDEVTDQNRDMRLKLTEMIGHEAQRSELIAENKRPLDGPSGADELLGVECPKTLARKTGHLS